MKKIIFSLVALAAAVFTTTTVFAQYNPLENLPNKKGERIVNKCYDSEGNLHATMSYEIADYYVGELNDYLEIVFTLTDAAGEVIDYGTIYANYDGENLNLSMSNRPEEADIASYISMNTKLMNDFLDYPDPFYSNDPFQTSPFALEGAKYTIKKGAGANHQMNIQVSDREWVADEKVTTPAGEFEASKIRFNLDVYDNNTRKTTTYNGTEWYAIGDGIVRTEITDQKGNIVDYSMVTDIYTR